MQPLTSSIEKELSIDTVEGLQEFLRFLEDVYRDYVVLLQQTGGTEVMVTGDVVLVEAAHHRAQELVEHHSKILAFGGELYPADIDELQAQYNCIVEAFDRLNGYQPVSISASSASSEPSYQSGIDATLDRAALLAERGASLLYEFSELEEAKPKTAELKLGKLLYDQLKRAATEVRQKIADITHLERVAEPAELLHVAASIDAGLDEIEATFNQLEKSLLRFFEADEFKDQSPDRKVAADQLRKEERAMGLFQTASVFSELVKSVVAIPEYAAILKTKYSSPAAFEAALKREVARLEAPSKLDSFLGIKHASAFLFLKDMTLAEIQAFDGREHREDIRADLQEKNIPYETYMSWIYALSPLESLVEVRDEMTFGELYVRAEIELLHYENEAAASNSQGVNKK